MIIATLDTSSFEFMLLAFNRKEAEHLAKLAWAKHCQEYGADPDYVSPDDWNYVDMQAGDILRGGERILKVEL